MHLIDGPTPGTGKTLLLTTCLMPALGTEVPLTTLGPEEEEIRKK